MPNIPKEAMAVGVGLGLGLMLHDIVGGISLLGILGCIAVISFSALRIINQ